MPVALADACARLVGRAPFLALGDTGGGYRLAGRGPRLVVVLPGILGPADALAALAEALDGEARTAFVTWPRAASWPDLHAWLRALAEREGGGLPVSVYGGSFGGLVAQAWLREQPAAIGDMVISGTGPAEPARAERNRRALRWMRRVPIPVWRLLLRVAVRQSTSRTPDAAAWRAFYRPAVDRLTWTDLDSRYRIAIDIDRLGPPSPADLARWRGRLLVLEGGRDRVARGPARTALRAVYAEAAFQVFETAGHGLALEEPEAWLAAVSGFLGASPPRT